MRFAFHFLFIVSAAGLLASCQTLSKDECAAADWQVIGEQDGSEGHDPQDRFGRHVKACERAGIIPDQTLWNQGYQRGILHFCTPTRGLAHGQSGGAYNRVCPPELEPGFMRGYELGASEYRTKREISNLENRIRTVEREIDDLDDKLAGGKIDEDEGRRKIRRKRGDIRDHNREIGRLEADLGSIERRIELFRQNPLNTGVVN